MGTDPYAAPKARVADIRAPQEDDFLPDGRALPAGRGWSWISGGRALTRQQSLTWIGIFVLFAVIAIVLSFVPLIGALAMYFIGPVLFGGVMLACDDAHEDRQVRVSQLFSAFGSHLGKLLGIGLFSLARPRGKRQGRRAGLWPASCWAWSPIQRSPSTVGNSLAFRSPCWFSFRSA